MEDGTTQIDNGGDVQPIVEKKNGRRRSCVVCENSTENRNITSFTRRLDKQSTWINVISNGNQELFDSLTNKVVNQRRYICFDHFDRDQLGFRGDGTIEVLRFTTPMPYLKDEFIRNRHEEYRMQKSDNYPKTRKRKRNVKKVEEEIEDNGGNMTESEGEKDVEEGIIGGFEGIFGDGDVNNTMILMLMNAANYFIEKAMNN